MPHFNNLADAAEYLARQSEVMENYTRFQDKKQAWFLSPNSSLSGATPKPGRFMSWSDWNKLYQNQRRFLIERAHLKETSISAKDYSKLKSAYSMWPLNLYPVYWGGGDAEAYTCSVFVGDCMYYCNIPSHGGKYYAAKNFWEGKVNGFSVVDKAKGVKRGDVAVFYSGVHVEIVTSVDTETNLLGNLSFCSRGAGRPSDQGEEKCGFSLLNVSRSVNDATIKFLRLI